LSGFEARTFGLTAQGGLSVVSYNENIDLPQVVLPGRHRCRNPHCRVKLPAPVENEHHAFCTRGCYESFYCNRCRVCERDLRKNGKRGDAGRLYCRPPEDCKAEARKWPSKYEYRGRVGISPTNTTNAHSTGSKTGFEGERPRPKALRHWSWHSDENLEHELRDANGMLLARIESNAGRHRLTLPKTIPILSWPGLTLAKRRAEGIALANLPDPLPERARNSPHPMGPPFNRQVSREPAITSDWRPTSSGVGIPDIPDFLRHGVTSAGAVATTVVTNASTVASVVAVVNTAPIPHQPEIECEPSPA
jgi:hypothetical protein